MLLPALSGGEPSDGLRCAVLVEQAAAQAASVPPPAFDGARAALLKASRRRYGGDTMTIAPADGESAAAAAACTPSDGAWAVGAVATPSELQQQLRHPAPQLPPVVVNDEPADVRVDVTPVEQVARHVIP